VTTTNAHRRAAAAALGKIALLDRFPQEPQAAVIEAWAELLAEHGLDSVDDALAAVKAHALASPKPPTPHDLVAGMRAIRRDRQSRETEPERQARIAATEAKLAPNVAAAAQRQREIARFAGRTGTVPNDAA
jgi:hypothetical protein